MEEHWQFNKYQRIQFHNGKRAGSLVHKTQFIKHSNLKCKRCRQSKFIKQSNPKCQNVENLDPSYHQIHNGKCMYFLFITHSDLPCKRRRHFLNRIQYGYSYAHNSILIFKSQTMNMNANVFFKSKFNIGSKQCRKNIRIQKIAFFQISSAIDSKGVLIPHGSPNQR